MQLKRYERSGNVPPDPGLHSLQKALPAITTVELRQWDMVKTLPRHIHTDVFHLDHFLSGVGAYRIGDTLHPIDARTFFFVPPETPHQLTVQGSESLTHLSIKFRCSFLATDFVPYAFQPDGETTGRVERMLRGLAEQLFEDPRKTAMASLMLMETLLILHEAAHNTPKAEGEHVLVVKAMHFMDENFAQRLTLDDIANATGVVGPHLCRVFKRETGQTPFEYLRGVRLSCAKYWLSQTQEKLSRIAQATGFGAAQEMNRAFQKIEGMSPREYRRAVSGNGVDYMVNP